MEPKQPLAVRVTISGPMSEGATVGPYLFKGTLVTSSGETHGAPAATPELAAVHAIKLSWLLGSDATRAALVTWHAGAGRTMVALVPTSGELLGVQSPSFTWIEL